MAESLDPATLSTWLVDGHELALLDARELGVFFDSHLFHAACIPLSRLELMLEGLVPRRDTRTVWCDGGDGHRSLAADAAGRAESLGWTNQHVLDGGCAAWEANGGELYSGVNVPSKAFGEFVEHTYDTPRIPAAELQAMLDDDTDLIVLDSRPMNEFRNMSIPTGTDCPGAELVHRVKEMAPDPATTVVVNCAGRTRSIIGAQSLINAGLENRVVALENGTMGWELAGLTVARGREVHAPDPTASSQAWSETAAAAVGRRFGVESIDVDQLDEWKADSSRTTYVLDVRTIEEFKAGHRAGSSHAAGGQLVQATDEYVATQNARIVLVDDNGVRATMTASWLRQLGWHDAVVLVGGLVGELVSGPEPRASVEKVPTIKVSELAGALGTDGLAVLDLDSSVKYRNRGHVFGAWWGVRSRLDEARAVIGSVERLVLVSSDGQLARVAVADAQERWPEAEVVALAGGTRAWRHAGLDMELGFGRATTDPNDVWYKPYDHPGDVAEQHMRDYLTWEIALVDQIDRDPTIWFPTFPLT
ncbi:MAG: thiosulfate sulfurtransferase [Acidimicrobiaceae bacterium]|mgnify:CR=1 FL=1|jgi:rhodanese-related sulfurtransferase|nr:thiosulfate sulfurtransferase [Acidimicrobiaceae bacterium]MBT5849595.1 thiosulfate sulfurtransferase [Acidimicrobiaceae bacterium]